MIKKMWTTWSPSLIEVADQVDPTRVPPCTWLSASHKRYSKPSLVIKTKWNDHVALNHSNSSSEQNAGHLLRRPWLDWFTHHHHKNKKEGHDFKVKMARITNLTSIHPNSKYIEGYMELKFEVHELSCFDF